jgi:Mg2+ and Co2+ transporter CorA
MVKVADDSPMNLVTGLWGMNVHVPGQDIESGVSRLHPSRMVLICSTHGSHPS